MWNNGYLEVFLIVVDVMETLIIVYYEYHYGMDVFPVGIELSKRKGARYRLGPELEVT